MSKIQPAPTSAAGQFNRDLQRAGLPDAGASSDQWRYLLTLVCTEYAYCTMYGVNIVDGNIISCANIQRSLTFGPTTADAAATPAFDEYWQALQTLCGRIRNGHLAELRFNRGKPVSARTSEGGRRFKRLLRTDS
ncbi:MAG: hypothetical protein HY923_10170 [Elusimicrobia bacterium]|nr:hypothetical protein [Elusimicrobiota bacterium]